MSTRPYTSVWSDLTQVEFSQGFLQAGPYRTRYLHAGDDSKPVLLMLHGITGHAEAYVRNLAAHAEHFSVLGDRLHRPRLLQQARPPAGDPALHRPGQPRPGHPRRGEGVLHRRVARRLGHRPVRRRPPRAGRADRAQHHGRHDGQPEGDGAALHPVHGGGEGPVLGAGQGPAGVADGRPDHGHRRPDPDPAGDLPAARLAQGVRGEHGAAGPRDPQAQHAHRRRPARHPGRGAGAVDHQGPLRPGRRGQADRLAHPQRPARGHGELRALAPVRGHRHLQHDPPRLPARPQRAPRGR